MSNPAARELAQGITRRTDTPHYLELRTATIVGVDVDDPNNPTVSVRFATTDQTLQTPVDGVLFYSWYTPVIAEIVDVLIVGRTLRVLGRLAGRQFYGAGGGEAPG